MGVDLGVSALDVRCASAVRREQSLPQGSHIRNLGSLAYVAFDVTVILLGVAGRWVESLFT